MSAISLKSITGITSITTPAGVDNQLTLHTNNTTERVKIDVAGNVHVNNHLNITGITTHNEDVWFKGATSGRDVYWDKSASQLRFKDNTVIYLGSNNDAFLSHDGSSTRLQDNYGHFFIGGNLIQIKSGNLQKEFIRMNNADNTVKLYYNTTEQLSTTGYGVTVLGTTETQQLNVTGVTTVSDNIEVVDNKHVYWGTDKDLSITHNGTHGFLHAINGGFYMKVGNGEFLSRNGSQVIAKFLQGTGGVELYHNNVKKTYTSNNGFYITDTGRAAMARVIAPAGYDARIDLTADTHGNEDNYRIEVNTDQKFRVYGKPGGNYTSFIELDQVGKVTLTRDVDVARHLDVGGHTELDNVNIVGVTTHNGQSKFYGNGGAPLIWGDTGYSGHLSFDGSNNAVVRAASGKALVFQTNHVNTRMTIGSQGNVSINNDLDVDGQTNLDHVSIAGITTFTNGFVDFKPGNGGNAHFRILSTGSGEAGIFFDAANGDIAGSDYVFIGQKNNLDFVINPNANAGNIDFQRAGNTQLRITSGGVLLLNQTSAYGTNQMMIINGASHAGNAYNGQLMIQGSETNGYATTGGRINFAGHDGNTARSWANITGAKENGTAGNVAGYLSFDTRPDGGNPTERLRITSSGEVGINVTDPETYGLNGTGYGGLVVETPSGNYSGITIRSNYAAGGALFFADGNGSNAERKNLGFAADHVNKRMNFIVEGSTVCRFTANGFHPNPADSAATTALDDYEEGLWTPTITGATGTFSGQYTKIGNRLFWALQIVNLGGSGNFHVQGLPFGVSNGWGGNISISDNNHSPEHIYVFAHNNSSSIYFRNDSNNTLSVQTFSGHFFYCNGVYQTA